MKVLPRFDFIRKDSIGADALASVVVFLVALPLCMGIAIASGMPPAAGLITGVIGGIIVGLYSGSPLMVSGPAAGLAVLVFELVTEHGVIALGPVVLLAGVIQLIAGIARVGAWFRMVSPAVVSGMLAGIGLLIIASQAHVMFDASPRAAAIDNLAALPQTMLDAVSDHRGDASYVAGLLGLATIAIMLAWDKLRPQRLRFLPGALLAVVAVTAVSQLAALPVSRVDLPGNLMSAVQPVHLGSLAMLLDPRLLIAAAAFAFIASAETLLSAAAVDRMHQGVRTDYNRELGAQGLGNLLCGALGALPMTGVIVRSAANVQAGAKTRASAVLHGGWLLLFVLALPWLLRMTPVACLAGILVYTGFKMMNPKQLKDLSDYGRGTVAVFAITALTIVATDLLVGVVTGVMASLLRLALNASTLVIRLRQIEPGRAELRLVGSASFLNVPLLAAELAAVAPGTRLQLDIERLRFIDQGCLELLRDWSRSAPTHGSSLDVDWAALEQRKEGSARRALAQFAAASPRPT